MQQLSEYEAKSKARSVCELLITLFINIMLVSVSMASDSCASLSLIHPASVP
jgi:hypothetical protein